MKVISGCRYNCAPDEPGALCDDCRRRAAAAGKSRPKVDLVPVPVVDLPLGATEDRVVGALDLEKALSHGVKAFEPGLLARAHRGFLYIDEANLLEDHLVDLLLDVAASGENVVEREGLSVRHPARFVLVGTGNPEEGELRPQLLDRFGLSVEVRTPTDLPTRIDVVRRRDSFDRDPAGFVAFGRRKRPGSPSGGRGPDSAGLGRRAGCCAGDGRPALHGARHGWPAGRADACACRACLASLEAAPEVADDHLRRIATSALRHRLRRNPLDEAGSTVRVERAVEELFGA
jgi:magnesium chelatase subunit I